MIFGIGPYAGVYGILQSSREGGATLYHVRYLTGHVIVRTEQVFLSERIQTSLRAPLTTRSSASRFTGSPYCQEVPYAGTGLVVYIR